MLIVDAEGKVIDVNPTLQGWLGPFLQLGDTGWVLTNGLPFTPANNDTQQKVDWEISSYGIVSAKVCEVIVQSIQFQDEPVDVSYQRCDRGQSAPCPGLARRHDQDHGKIIYYDCS